MYAADDNYAWLAGISLLSFLVNNKETKHNIYILDNNISKDNKERIDAIVKKYQSSIFYIDVSGKLTELIAGMNNEDTAYDKTVYARIIAPDLLPSSVERVTYIDCDTLILKNIQELDEIEINKVLLMRPDCLHNSYKKYIGMSKADKYYNSGIIVINVPVWKKHKCTEAFNELIHNRIKSYPFADQDIINTLFFNEIEEINIPGYNAQSQMFLYDYKRCLKIYDLNEENYLKEEDYQETIENPKIVHFCGQSLTRPWYLNSNHPYAKKWKEYFNMSPWTNRKLETYNVSFPNKVRYFLYKYCPKNTEMLISKIANRCYIIFRYKV